MTKQQEIDILAAAADKLGPDSYCGPWLRDQIPFVEHDMRSDFLPTPSWTDSRKLHEGHLALAKEQADRILKQAKEEADRIKREGADYAKNIRIAALNAIERAVREIESR